MGFVAASIGEKGNCVLARTCVYVVNLWNPIDVYVRMSICMLSYADEMYVQIEKL